MGKSKGIVIELTALLDVIFIMLFWVMINVQESNERVRAEADEQVSQAAAEAQEAALEKQAEFERLEREMQEKLNELERQKNEAQSFAENIDKIAYANERALEGYEQGRLLTLNLRYDDGGQLYITGSEGGPEAVSVSSQKEIYASIISALKASKLSTDDVVMCAMVYDGDVALYRDVRTVREAVEQVTLTYGSFYCAYINTSTAQ